MNDKELEEQTKLMFDKVHGAVLSGDRFGATEEVKSFFQNGMDTEVRESLNDFTPLLKASSHAYKSCSIDIIKYLVIEKKADVHARGKNGETSLLHAVYKGNLNLAALLLDNGADAFDYDNDACNAFDCLADAARNNLPGSLNELEELLVKKWEKGLESNVQAQLDMAFIEAASNGTYEEMVAFHEQGAHIDAKYKDGKTPLLKTILNSDDKKANYLIYNGANVKRYDHDLQYPLMTASAKGLVTVIDNLLKHGASRDSWNNSGQTAYGQAYEQGQVGSMKALRMGLEPLDSASFKIKFNEVGSGIIVDMGEESLLGKQRSITIEFSNKASKELSFMCGKFENYKMR